MTEDTIPEIPSNQTDPVIRANFNALMYLLTEQMAVNVHLLNLLVEKEVLTLEEANEKVLAVTGDKEKLTEIYGELFQRFAGYYRSVVDLMDKNQFETSKEDQ